MATVGEQLKEKRAQAFALAHLRMKAADALQACANVGGLYGRVLKLCASQFLAHVDAAIQEAALELDALHHRLASGKQEENPENWIPGYGVMPIAARRGRLQLTQDAARDLGYSDIDDEASLLRAAHDPVVVECRERMRAQMRKHLRENEMICIEVYSPQVQRLTDKVKWVLVETVHEKGSSFPGMLP